METWDAYYADGTPAGRDLVRGEAIPEGLFHLVVEVTVRHADGNFLLMQRAFTKSNFPGLYEATAGGSVYKGETALEGAARELKEETGLIAGALMPLYRIVRPGTIYCGYCCCIDCNKNAVSLQDGETIAFLWLPTAAFLKLLHSEYYVPSHRERLLPHLAQLLRYTGNVEMG